MTGGAGQDDGEDVTNLLDAMRRVAREDDAEIGRFPSTLAPTLSDETLKGIADRIIGAQAQAREQPREPEQGNQVHEIDSLALRREARWAPRRALILAASGIVLAAAAAFVMWIRPPAAEGTPLPGYFASASGGVAELRGGRPDATGLEGTTTPTERLRADSELRVTCRPDRAIDGAVAVRAFFVQGGDVEEVKPLVQRATTGAVELRLRGADLVGRHRGQGTLRVVVGRPGAVQAADARAVVDEAAAGRSDRRWLTVPLDLESP